MRRRSRAVLTTLAAALAVSALPTSPVATAGTGRFAYDGYAPGDAAVEYLATTYHLTTAEAIRRLTLQDKAPAVDVAARRALGAAHGGTWIDQENGGDIVVGTTRPLPAGARFSVPNVRTRIVRYSVAQLSAIERALARVADPSAQVDGLRLVENAVAVRLRTGATMPPAMARIAAGHPGAVTIERGLLRERSLECTRVSTSAAFNGDLRCDPPLRGGTAMYYVVGTTPVSMCSTGFFVRSKTSALPYVITAGHCSRAVSGTSVGSMRTDGAWKELFINETWHTIGDNHNSYVNEATDAGIVAIDNEAGWTPENWVYSNNQVRIEDYAITAIGGSTVGMAVCHTGATTGTSCGTVTVVPYDGGAITKGVARVTGGCAFEGDSGGPIFKAHTAYGLLHKGYWTEGESPYYCTDMWSYVGITGAANALNVNVVTS